MSLFTNNCVIFQSVIIYYLTRLILIDTYAVSNFHCTRKECCIEYYFLDTISRIIIKSRMLDPNVYHPHNFEEDTLPVPRKGCYVIPLRSFYPKPDLLFHCPRPLLWRTKISNPLPLKKQYTQDCIHFSYQKKKRSSSLCQHWLTYQCRWDYGLYGVLYILLNPFLHFPVLYFW